MIHVLFSPSEGKRPGGAGTPLNDGAVLFGLRMRRLILDAYNAIAAGGDEAAAMALFGLRKPADAAAYRHDIFTAPTMPAAERYDGVAYDHLDIGTLDADARRWLDEHLLIFSNLFGIVRGGDLIPAYKVKQGNRIGTFVPEHFYRERLTEPLNDLLGQTEILDLRAGYYDRFYRPSHPVTAMKFVKDGRVVSHWAKAYRGIVLRHLARHRFETVDALLASEIKNLRIREILQKGKKREVVYDILPE